MTQHYPRNVKRLLVWCETCRKLTFHRVDDRRLGPCMEDHAAGLSKKQLSAQEKRNRDLESEKQQPRLL